MGPDVKARHFEAKPPTASTKVHPNSGLHLEPQLTSMHRSLPVWEEFGAVTLRMPVLQLCCLSAQDLVLVKPHSPLNSAQTELRTHPAPRSDESTIVQQE